LIKKVKSKKAKVKSKKVKVKSKNRIIEGAFISFNAQFFPLHKNSLSELKNLIQPPPQLLIVKNNQNIR
jgi:transcription antitermination factor NusG